jgi:molybdopterin synthase sulfur carrier subunit
MPAIRVRVASLLYSYTGGKSVVEVDAGTVGEAIAALEQRFPGVAFRIVDEQRQIRPHMNVFLNEEKVRDLGEPVSAGDEIYIVGALSGG